MNADNPYAGDLFTTAPYVKGSETSKAAAESIKESTSSIRAKIYALIAASDFGMTCDEVEAKTNLLHQTASARVRELVLQKRIADSGAKRKTRSGRGAVVYEALA